MRKEKDIQTDILQLKGVKAKLQVELGQFQDQEKVALDKLSAEMLTGATGSTDGLVNLRIRKEGMGQALELANQKLALAEQELSDMKRSEAVQTLNVFIDSFWPRLAKMKAQLGAPGLNGEIEALYGEMRAAVQAYTSGGGNPPDIVNTIERGLAEFNRKLLETWQSVDSLQKYDPDRQSRQPAEFGKPPERL
jgi:hypothetical protein